ncbi:MULTISPECIES: CPBP family intramembrane glutamic endopeptidase [Flavobacterium]|uniref:CPBP family intramembrane glutamic endopeptidase n=1 Tax=Flavobacterium TaxID=237 RepID=UPI001FCC46CA|nr:MULTISPECIES: CPBP family intramembrane glutamic endopeptidase [Flavobacterium]UOK41578.1 CPBP family intramembrane metalloprotease [Flavobacterium enshiense]
MFIEQIKNKDFNFILYLPVLLGFTGLMLANYLMTQDVSADALMDQMIESWGSNLTFVFVIIPLSLMCLGLLFWVKFIHRQSIRSLTTARKKVDWSRIFFSFGLWASVSALLTLLSYLSSPENFVFNFEPIPFFTFMILAVILIPLQTSFEEYLFRGYLMQGLGVITNSRFIPFLVSSILFGLMHIANPEVGKLGLVIMIYYIGTGFFLGIVTLMDDGLELALGFHAANNLIGALLVTADWTAFQTNSILKDISEPTAGFDIMVPVFIIFPMLLYIFAKRYGWSDWKGKLTGKLVQESDIETKEI